MKQEIKMLILFIGMGIGAGHADAVANVVDSNPSVPQYIHVYRHSETSLKIIWKRGKSADGYVVLRYDSKAKKYTKIGILLQ